MLEHRIRLRRGWEWRVTGSAEREVQRLELPTVWNFDVPRRLTLTRRFGRPALEPARQVLILQMEEVSGILAIFVNGHSIAPVSATISQYKIELADLAERNVLVLDIETPLLAASSAGRPREWGVIALVVHTTEPADDPIIGQIAPGIGDELHLE